MTRILFVIQELSYEPQGIMSMSAVLKQAGHEVSLSLMRGEDPIRTAQSFQPDILGFSLHTGSQAVALSWNRRTRAVLDPLRAAAGARPALSVFGGPHPTFFPEMIDEAGVDAVCVGEGEGAIVDLANALRDTAGNGNGFNAAIPNWWFKIDGEVLKNEPRALIADLSSLPMPDRALIYDKSPELAGSRIKHFMTSRGCPYSCTYCFNHAYYQIYHGARRGYQRSVEDVIAEVKAVRARWPLEQVVFVDDLFILNDAWLQQLATRWPDEVGLPFFCNVRADLLARDPHKVELLRRAGCHTVSMGIEAANHGLRVNLLKRSMSNGQIVAAGRMVREAGMTLTATNIIGLPTSTLEDDLATMRLNARAGVSYAYAFLFQPYPGTELGRFTEDQGLLAGTFDDIGHSALDQTILKFPPDHKRQVEHLGRLFALGVEWPRLEPVIRRLIKLPQNKFVETGFWWFHKLHKGFAMLTRVHPVGYTPGQVWLLAKHFFKIRG